MLKQKQKLKNFKRISVLSLVAAPLIYGICALSQSSLEAATRFYQQPKNREQIIEYFNQGPYREFKLASEEEVKAIRDYLGGLNGPDGLYHELSKVRSLEN